MANVSLDDRCSLVYSKETAGEMGGTDITLTEKDVFCGIKSITSKEFADAVGKMGIKPELVVIVRREVFNDAVAVRYKGKLYSIYRHYLSTADRDYMELYLTIKEGVEYGGII